MTSLAPQRILLVRFSSIGDLLLTTPLIRALRHRYPRANITFVTRSDMADTLRDNPHLTRVIEWPRGSSLRALAEQLRQTRWTNQLDLHGSLRSRLLRTLIGGSWRGYPKHRVRRRLLISTHGRRGGMLGAVAERYFAAARDLDVQPDGQPAEFFVTPAAAAGAATLLREHRLALTRPLIALAPGAAHFTKRWPAEHWCALARKLGLTHNIIVLGGATERDVARRIVAAAPPGAATSAAGEVTLAGTAALLRRCRALVAGDTGVLHLASAVATPAVGIYGPTVEAFGFFPYQARSIAVQHTLPCRPCSSQGGPVCPLGHHHCLVRIVPEEVTAALATLLAERPA